MVERASSPYPLQRAGRRRRPSWSLAIGKLGRGRLAAIAVLLGVALAAVLAVHAVRPDARQSSAKAHMSLAAGNYTAARDQALAALEREPGNVAALMVLARAYLELGDGLAADAVLTRAQSAGMPPQRLHALRAAARLLQGDPEAALAEAARPGPADAIDATRVRARALAAQGDAAAAQRLLLPLTDAGAIADLGRIRFDIGDIGGAAEAAARAAADGRGSPAALTLQGEVLRSRFGLLAALPWFEAALKRDPGYLPALVEYAATLGEAGRNVDALAAARRALAARPGSPQPLYLLSVMAARAGNMELARAILQHAGHALDDLPGGLLLAGALDQAQGHSELAVAAWRQLLDRQPDNHIVRRLLAAALLQSGDARGAVDAAMPIVTRGDADSYALEIAARAAWVSGDRAVAATLHDRAITFGRGPAGVFAPAGTVATLSIDAASAPGDPSRALGLIRGLLASGDAGGAINRARGLATALPGTPAAQLVVGDALFAADRVGEAATFYTRAADLAFDEPTMLKLVDAFGRLGRNEDAARALALYAEQNPQSVDAMRIVGHWQTAAGDYDAAIATLERVRNKTGNRDAAVLADLALAYAGTGKAQVACRYARAAYALAPMNLAVVKGYAEALTAAGEADGARQLQEKAQALRPNRG